MFGSCPFIFCQTAHVQPALQQTFHVVEVQPFGLFRAIAAKLTMACQQDGDLRRFAKLFAFLLENAACFEHAQIMFIAGDVVVDDLQDARKHRRPHVGQIRADRIRNFHQLLFRQTRAQKALLLGEHRVVQNFIKAQRKQLRTSLFHRNELVVFDVSDQFRGDGSFRNLVQALHLRDFFPKVVFMQQIKTPAGRMDGHFFIVDGRHRDAAAFEAIRDFRRRQLQTENAVATRHIAGQIIFRERFTVAVDDAGNLLRTAEFAQE